MQAAHRTALRLNRSFFQYSFLKRESIFYDDEQGDMCSHLIIHNLTRVSSAQQQHMPQLNKKISASIEILKDSGNEHSDEVCACLLCQISENYSLCAAASFVCSQKRLGSEFLN